MVRFSKIILSLLILSFSFQAQAKNPPPGSGTSDIPANILIMLDTSGSMNSKLYSSVQVYYPLDVSTDSAGNVYVLEYYNSRIKVFDSSGAYLRSFGSYGYGCNQWRYARQFTIYDDKIYLTDTYNHKIKVMSLSGGCITSKSSDHFYPHAIAASSSHVYVGFTSWQGYGIYIRAFQRNGINNGVSYRTSGNGRIMYAWGMSLNAAENKLIIADYFTRSGQLVEFSVNGANLSYLQKNSTNYFNYATDVGYDSSGNIYALDLNKHRILKFNSSLVLQATTGGYSSTTGFRYPYGMHVDSNDKIYVTDFYNYAVRQYDTSLTETATFKCTHGEELEAASHRCSHAVSGRSGGPRHQPPACASSNPHRCGHSRRCRSRLDRGFVLDRRLRIGHVQPPHSNHPDRISRSWLPLSVARAYARFLRSYGVHCSLELSTTQLGFADV